MEIVLLEPRETGAPGGLSMRLPSATKRLAGSGCQLRISRTPTTREKVGLRLERRRRVGPLQRRVGDVTCGDAAGFVDALQPMRLGNGLVGRPARLDMNRADDRLVRGVLQIISRQVVAPERREITEPCVLIRLRRQPGWLSVAAVPEMVMRIDHGSVVSRHGGASGLAGGKLRRGQSADQPPSTGRITPVT